MCCPLVFEFSVGIGGFVIGLGQFSFFFSLYRSLNREQSRIYCAIDEVPTSHFIWFYYSHFDMEKLFLYAPGTGGGSDS